MELKLDPKKTYAIALEGGGAKGAYEIGVWKALKEAGIQFDAVAGTSVGALNGAMMAIGDLDKAIDCWTNISLQQVLKLEPGEEDKMGALVRGEFGLGDIHSLQDLSDLVKKAYGIIKNGGLDIGPLRSWIAEVIDAEALKNSPVQLYVTTVNLTDRETQEVHIQEQPVEEIHNMLMASAYHPTFKQEKLGGKNYADGGFFDTLPLHALTSSGHKDIIAVRLPSKGVERHFRMPDDVEVTLIETNADLGSVLNFEAEQAKRDMKIGYYDGLRALYGLAGETYYVEQTMSEKEALEVIVQLALERGLSGTLAAFLEEELPEIAKKQGVKAPNYRDYLLLYMEKCAEDRGIDPFRIITDRELLALIQ